MENNTPSENPVEYDIPNSVAAIWTMMLPGLGQMMKGRIMPGIFWGLLVSSGYFMYFWPGITLHALCILDAAFYKGKGSYLSFDTWPQRFTLVGVVVVLLVYIIYRNDFF